MKSKIHLFFALCVLLTFSQIIDLERKVIASDYAEIIDARSQFKKKKLKREAGIAKLDKPEMYGLIQRDLRTPIGEERPQYGENYLTQEIRKAQARQTKNYSRNELDFISRGPGNIAGRTRAILFDPRDETHSTWIAGSASGGIWKTENAGKEWRNVSADLTTLSTNTLAMSAANPDVIYAGTGEHFVSDTDGNGLWKSTDGGESWFNVASPAEYSGFRNVSRISVDPEDENTLIVSTSNGSWVDVTDYAIWKSTDGGATFQRVYTSMLGRIDDMNADPKDFSIHYAAIEQYGVIKSTDGGESWTQPGMSLPGVGRVEIDVSPVNSDLVWASGDGGPSGVGSTVFLSQDGGSTFKPVLQEENNINYLGGQGFYDNIITAHPYNEDEVYVGGVNIFKIAVVGEGGQYTSFNVDQLGTQEFMSYITGTNFQSEALIPQDELKSVEVRFGQGGQMAHRFTVGMQGAGVPFGNYSYADYVEVPFTVWDTENDVQLAVSFRDQQEDGAWNLLPANTDGSPGEQSRDYIFIHDVNYTESENAEIATDGGTEERLMYFIWPALQDGADFDADDLPLSTLAITRFLGEALESATAPVSDAYGGPDAINNFSTTNFINQEGLHPDQHNIVIIPEDDASESFRFLSTNDGGVYLTIEGTDPGTEDGDFSYAGFGLNTSQFYGADKAPGEDRYIGGMQDNSTFFTPAGESADSSTRYQYAIGGDGFESIWNNSNPAQLIGGSQFNGFGRSLDNGETWINATAGISEGGPFISRLANSKRDPNRLFTVGPSGVWKSEDFGGFWTLTEIGDGWSFNNSADVEVSHADSSVVWAGGFLSEGSTIFVSQDAGDSFSPVENYDGEDLGFVSGIGTHASDPGTAYLLFSFAGKPKVIRTTDYGQEWEDISGFEGNGGVSDRGFPDVAIQSLLVFPNNTQRIWVGSEIGIIESQDGGASWELLDCNMPPVNVHEFKIQDDQVVIATYGRGIWSVAVEGIEQDFFLPPSITDAALSLEGDLFIDYFLPSTYDSSRIYVDGEEFAVLGATEKGAFSELFTELGKEGEITLEIESFRGETSLFSLPYTLRVYIPGDVITQYNNDFSDLSSEADFAGFGFRLALEDGFQNEAIHSDHPHPNGADYTYQLTTPYLLTEESTNAMQFNEVAIIEPGEPETVFGDDQFWDFVVVEGSKDGKNWEALAPGYDCREYESWVTSFNNDAPGTDELYELRRIDLTETFAIGDTIVVRFRLNADQFVTGWGWAIDDLEIGDVSSSFNEVNVTSEIKLAPNPASSVLKLETEKDLSSASVSIFNLDGKLLSKTKGEQVINVSSLVNGTYILRIESDELRETHKFIKI